MGDLALSIMSTDTCARLSSMPVDQKIRNIVHIRAHANDGCTRCLLLTKLFDQSEHPHSQTAELITVGENEMTLHVWIDDSGVLQHLDVFAAEGVNFLKRYLLHDAHQNDQALTSSCLICLIDS